MAKIYGRDLNRKWGIGAKQAFYRETGDWYDRLERFPGALCDLHGYVLFETKEEYQRSLYLQIGATVHVPTGISAMPGYKRVSN